MANKTIPPYPRNADIFERDMYTDNNKINFKSSRHTATASSEVEEKHYELKRLMVGSLFGPKTVDKKHVYLEGFYYDKDPTVAGNWWVLKDLFDRLDIPIESALDNDIIRQLTNRQILEFSTPPDNNGVICISEDGLYLVIMGSNTIYAKEAKDKILSMIDMYFSHHTPTQIEWFIEFHTTVRLNKRVAVEKSYFDKE